eukprot:TRINITY_DN16844_c0_g1_i1.p1 TRINITY_DN16844_c0_g1~~TRINITY_DN16844_c0_g1_i1.p1  ORF type:complete len:567 (+),score=137.55 TRINITY_DN16844_c0_g1_i1:310-2010(+)
MSGRKRSADTSFGDLSSFLPSQFGKKAKPGEVNPQLDATRKKKVVKEEKVKVMGAQLPEPVYVFGQNMPKEKTLEEGEGGQAEYDDSVLDDPLQLPITHEVELKGHEGHVTALALDPKGSRLVTGGYDSVLKFWDFNAMDHRLQSFRTIEPEVDVVSVLNYSPTGDRIIMASNAPQAKVFDRDGSELVVFPKGYPYIRDMACTKGHVNHVTGAVFHPLKRDVAITSSLDCTIRIWNLESYREHKHIIKLKNAQGAVKSGVTAMGIDSQAKLIAACTQNGELHFYPMDGPYTKTSSRFNTAHQFGSETSSVRFSKDNIHLYTRGGDDTLKVWDIRKIEGGPLKVFEDLPNKYSETSVVESPSGELIATGTSVKGSQNDVGSLVFFSKSTLEQVKKIEVSTESVISILWHPELNQIFCGCSDRNVHVLYNPEKSKKGVMYCVSKHPKKVHAEDQQFAMNIQNPHALPLFKDQPSARRAREKARQDPVRSHRPDAPQIGPGAGGKLGSSLTASIMKDLVVKTEIKADPREALFKYHNDGEKSVWFQAYAKTQPTAIFRDVEEEEEEEKK